MHQDFLHQLAKADGYIFRETAARYGKLRNDCVSLKSREGRDLVLDVNGLRTSQLVRGALEQLLRHGYVALEQKNAAEGWERYRVTPVGLQVE
jgi:hypothetical protein